MLEFLNDTIINNQEFIAKITSALLLIIIGTPFVSFKGGIPRFRGIIVNKRLSLILLAILGLVILFVFDPLTNFIVRELIVKYTGLTIPVSILLGGIALFEFDQRMMWKYKFYWLPILAAGFIWLSLEFVF